MFKSKVRKRADSAPLCPVFHGARCAVLQSESPVRRKSGKQTNAVWRAEETTYFNVKWGFKRISSFFFFFTPKEKCRCKEYEVSRQLLQQPHGFSGLSTVSGVGLLGGRRSDQVRINLSFLMYFLCFPGFSFTRFLWCAFNHLIRMCGN